MTNATGRILVLGMAVFAGMISRAHGAPGMTLAADTTAPVVSGTLAVTVSISDAPPFATWGTYLRFDNAKLILVSQDAGNVSTFISDARTLAEINASGEVRAGGFNLADNAGGAGTLGTFTFQATATGATTITTEAVSTSNLFGDTLYTASGTVTAVSAGGPLAMVIAEATTPAIGLSTATLNFSAPAGGPNPSSQNVTITNTGTGNLVWSATPNHPWLTVNPATGTLGANASATIAVGVDVVTTGIAAGSYTGAITFAAPGTQSSPVISVAATIAPATAPPSSGGGSGGGGGGGCFLTEVKR